MESKTTAAALAMALWLPALASETVTVEPDPDSYHFVSHYSIVIDAPIETVWQHLVNLGSWMYEFEMALVSGTPGTQGEVRRLYSGQDFLVQTVKVIPNKLLVIANLPSTFQGESGTGISVMTLHENSGATTVDLTMSRRYTWKSGEPNVLKQRRESTEFANETRAMWQDRFLVDHAVNKVIYMRKA